MVAIHSDIMSTKLFENKKVNKKCFTFFLKKKFENLSENLGFLRILKKKRNLR